VGEMSPGWLEGDCIGVFSWRKTEIRGGASELKGASVGGNVVSGVGERVGLEVVGVNVGSKLGDFVGLNEVGRVDGVKEGRNETEGLIVSGMEGVLEGNFVGLDDGGMVVIVFV